MANNPRIQSARFCPACGEISAVPKGQKSPWYPLTRRQIEALPDLIQALRRNIGVSSCDGLMFKNACKSVGGSDYCVWCQSVHALNKAEGKPTPID